MDLTTAQAITDQYMSKKYADSSDEDVKEDKTVLKLFSLKSNVQRKQKRNLPSKVVFDDRSCHSEKPHLHVKPCSIKKPFLVDEGIQVPSPINQYLREYQRNGILFMWSHFKRETGCILGDDMGLGKTIQVIAFFAAVLKKTGVWNHDMVSVKGKGNTTFLVVAPTSVLYNWQDELDTWGYFKVGKFHGKSRDDVVDKVNEGKLEVILTTHDTMKLHIDILCSINWSAIIIDEAHRVKEASSMLAIAAKKLTGKCRIGLTGTPLQNNLTELWCLLDWANPGCLGTAEEFDDKFAKPIYFGQRYDANKRDLATARKKQQELSLLHARWLLRRTKDMISTELPQKYEKIVFCSLSPLQVAMYEAVLQLPKVKMLLDIDEECQCGSELLARSCCQKFFNRRKETFPHMQLLLKLSNHAALLLPHHRQTEQQIKLAKGICESLFQDFPILEDLYKHRNFATMSNPYLSGKMVVLGKLFPILQSKRDKLLLFSHSTKLLDILEAYVMSCGLSYRRLDGNTNAANRTAIVKEFNADSTIFLCLLSTTAGSLGLNFTAANFVVIFDPMWNPTHDQQAQDRAYRIGQRRDVHVYRLISVGTIEENIYMRQIYKQQLANAALVTSAERRYFAGVPGDRRYHGELFGLKNIFKFSKDHTSLFTKETFEKVKRIENEVTVADYTPVVVCTSKKASQCISDTDSSGSDDVEDDVSLNPPLICRKKMTNDDVESDESENRTVLKTKENCIYDAFVACGVSFVHSAKSLVGSSRTELQLSKRAIHDVFWNGVNSQQLANDEHDLQQESEESQDFEPRKQPIKVFETTCQSSRSVGLSQQIFERVGDDMFIIGSTPPAIQAKQFKEIAESQGFSSVEEFAFEVISNKNCNWQRILRDFYSSEYPHIKMVSSFEQVYDVGKDTDQSKRSNSVRTLTKRKLTGVVRKRGHTSINRNVSSSRFVEKPSSESSDEIDEFEDTENSSNDDDNAVVNVNKNRLSKTLIRNPTSDRNLFNQSSSVSIGAARCVANKHLRNQSKKVHSDSESFERTGGGFQQNCKHSVSMSDDERNDNVKRDRKRFLKSYEDNVVTYIDEESHAKPKLSKTLSDTSSIIDELMSIKNKYVTESLQSSAFLNHKHHLRVDQLVATDQNAVCLPSEVENIVCSPPEIEGGQTSSATSLRCTPSLSVESTRNECSSVLDELMGLKTKLSPSKGNEKRYYVGKSNDTSIIDELL